MMDESMLGGCPLVFIEWLGFGCSTLANGRLPAVGVSEMNVKRRFERVCWRFEHFDGCGISVLYDYSSNSTTCASFTS